MGEEIAESTTDYLAVIEEISWLEEDWDWGIINNNPASDSTAQPEQADSYILPQLAKHYGTVSYSFDAEDVTVNVSEQSTETSPETSTEPTSEPDTTEDYAAANIVASGTCGANGDNLTWTLDDAGLLTISGTGAMRDYSQSSNIPWYGNRNSICLLYTYPSPRDV